MKKFSEVPFARNAALKISTEITEYKRLNRPTQVQLRRLAMAVSEDIHYENALNPNLEIPVVVEDNLVQRISDVIKTADLDALSRRIQPESVVTALESVVKKAAGVPTDIRRVVIHSAELFIGSDEERILRRLEEVSRGNSDPITFSDLMRFPSNNREALDQARTQLHKALHVFREYGYKIPQTGLNLKVEQVNTETRTNATEMIEPQVIIVNNEPLTLDLLTRKVTYKGKSATLNESEMKFLYLLMAASQTNSYIPVAKIRAITGAPSILPNTVAKYIKNINKNIPLKIQSKTRRGYYIADKVDPANDQTNIQDSFTTIYYGPTKRYEFNIMTRKLKIGTQEYNVTEDQARIIYVLLNKSLRGNPGLTKTELSKHLPLGAKGPKMIKTQIESLIGAIPEFNIQTEGNRYMLVRE
ncbi:MAG: hypothetical protein M3Q44_08195 [bacterium]|nr:hypothetical protein [bacterium]